MKDGDSNFSWMKVGFICRKYKKGLSVGFIKHAVNSADTGKVLNILQLKMITSLLTMRFCFNHLLKKLLNVKCLYHSKV